MLQDAPSLRVSLATSETEIRLAQRLRYDVFVSELGSDGPDVDHVNRLEKDAFDPFADHLLLRDDTRAQEAGQGIIGVYRVMTREHAQRAGRFYSESEFDLSVLKDSNRRLLELGRSCLHPSARGGGSLMALWQGLAAYVRRHRLDTLFGVASFHGTDPQRLQNALSHLLHAHLAPEPMRVQSRTPEAIRVLAKDQVDRKAAMRETPALIKSYLRLGGCVGQGIYVDHAFNTTDVCMLLDTSHLPDDKLGRSLA